MVAANTENGTVFVPEEGNMQKTHIATISERGLIEAQAEYIKACQKEIKRRGGLIPDLPAELGGNGGTAQEEP